MSTTPIWTGDGCLRFGVTVGHFSFFMNYACNVIRRWVRLGKIIALSSWSGASVAHFQRISIAAKWRTVTTPAHASAAAGRLNNVIM